MSAAAAEWLAPSTLGAALALRAERADATVLAGGTFLGILVNQGFAEPTALLSLAQVAELRALELAHGGELRIGAMVTHRTLERDPRVREGWPALAHAFSLVASPRVRNQATVGGVLADADYASDPPAMLAALEARAVLRSARGEREVAIDDLILGYYETCIAPDELLVEVRVPPAPDRGRLPQVPLALERGPAMCRRRRRPARGRAPRRRRRRRRHAAALPRRVRAGRRERRRDRRGVRGADRADRRRPRLRRLPPARHRRRGPPRDRGAGMSGLDPRVTGEQAYSVDVTRPRMLHAAFVRSPYAHARVTGVDASAVPPGCVTLLPEDVAALGRYGCQARDQRVLADVARHAGDIVAAVAAPTRAAARSAARRIARRLRGAARRLRRGRRRRPRRAAPARRHRGVGAGGGLDRRPPAPGHQRLPPLPARLRRRRARHGRSRRRRERGVPHPERRARPDGAARRRRRVGGRAADAVDRHADAVQHARRPRRPVRARARGRPHRRRR